MNKFSLFREEATSALADFHAGPLSILGMALSENSVPQW